MNCDGFQEYCYDNMNFLKSFNKIIILLYKTDVLSEDAILKWYKESHSSRGWSVFMDQVGTKEFRGPFLTSPLAPRVKFVP
jgi:hypothetical protein